MELGRTFTARVALAAAALLAVAAGAASFALGAHDPAHARVDVPTAPPADGAADAPAPLPERLSDTGLFAAGDDPTRVAAGILSYTPQYPLWTDGADKRRWLALPEGAAIDASDPNAWRFPAGTRLWKEFSFGRRVETRYMEALEGGGFRYATYVWSADGRDAWLQPPDVGLQVAVGDQVHDVPSESDCRACHEGRPSGVLGINALQLSPDRDPGALHAGAPAASDVDLRALAARGLLRGLPRGLLRTPPRIPARSARERSALGYLFGNCGGCHNAQGPLAQLGLSFDQGVDPRANGGATPASRPLPSAVDARADFRIPGAHASARIASGSPETSVVAYRMGSRFAASQMPPLGTRRVDDEALELIRNWIAHDLSPVAQGKGRQP